MRIPPHKSPLKGEILIVYSLYKRYHFPLYRPGNHSSHYNRHICKTHDKQYQLLKSVPIVET